MDGQNGSVNRPAWIGLTVLVLATLLIFAFVFLDAGNMFGSSVENPSSQTDVNSDVSSVDSDRITADIAEYRALMTRYQTRLDSSYLLLVNEENPLSDDYTVELAPLNQGEGSLMLEKFAASALNTFLSSAERAGYEVTVTAAYRSKEAQKKLYDSEVAKFVQAHYDLEESREKAAKKVGSVNCSEHQLGFAVDFNVDDLSQKGYDGKTFLDYLNENIHKFGFVLSYPSGEEDVTGRDANTAHYRYVGMDIATEMKEKLYVTVSEYRDYLSTQIRYYKQQIDSLEKR